ncbi:hypothetical protein [Haloplanus sp. C73]|uniref:hypothetical protein n=1 Tax=Haloplanus sp. C73 TaxID=3421641 RepID=UPI003EB7A300
MKRRVFIAGLGAITGIGGATLGTGAFTATTADRQLSVEIARDSDALLTLTELGDGGRSVEDGGEVKFRFPSMSERAADPDLGLGTDSVYEFDQDVDEIGASNPVMGLLRIENQGTQPVEVYSNDVSNSGLEFELYDVTDSSRTALRDSPIVLNVGQSVDVGVRITTHGVAIGSFQETIQIIAQAV